MTTDILFICWQTIARNKTWFVYVKFDVVLRVLITIQIIITYTSSQRSTPAMGGYDFPKELCVCQHLYNPLAPEKPIAHKLSTYWDKREWKLIFSKADCLYITAHGESNVKQKCWYKILFFLLCLLQEESLCMKIQSR